MKAKSSTLILGILALLSTIDAFELDPFRYLSMNGQTEFRIALIWNQMVLRKHTLLITP